MTLDHLWCAERRAERKVSRLYEEYSPKLEEAKRKGDGEYQAVLHNFFWEKDLIEEESKMLRSRRLENVAENLDVPFSRNYSDHDFWEQSPVSGAYYLTPKARADLRTLVRRQEKERYDEWARWVILGIALLSTLINVISLLNSLKKA